MTDVDQEAVVEARRDSDRLEEVRKWGERNEERAKEAEKQLTELRQTHRTSAIRQAGADPSSWLGQSVMAIVERDNISDPQDIEALVRLVQAEARGGQ